MKREITRLSGTLILAAFVQFAALSGRSEAQEQQPVDVVQKLYREVVARHPLGVPQGPAKTAIWPLLSKRLITAFEMRNACDLDWDRRHRSVNPPLKAPGVYEDGLFSGSVERGEINGALMGSTKVQPDGSYLVYVKVWSYFDMGEPSPSYWQDLSVEGRRSGNVRGWPIRR